MFFSYLSHYLIVERKLKNKALKRVEKLKRNNFFNEATSRLGNLPIKKNPTNFSLVIPDENKIRIGFFGDSHTEGVENIIGNDFPSLLQEIIGEKYQIINFGKGGYNSNQVYIAAKYFSKVFNLDILFLGPRGFYRERTSTFNNYWVSGNIPYSRFILNNNEIVEIVVKGKNLEEKVENYYSFLPSINLLKNDHAPPSLFKLVEMVFQKEFINPFLRKELGLGEIQIRLLEELSLIFKKKIIHYTDEEDDCLKFRKVTNKNYSLYCVNNFLGSFPYRAEISHPSAFGHYEHAKKIKNIILKKQQSELPRFRIASSNIVKKKLIIF